MTANYQRLAAERATECGERAAYFDSRLRLFSRTNWITVLIPSLLGVIAGSALFSSTHSVWMGFWVLVAALLGAVHKGLDCDAHQAECRRLVQAYRGFEVRYRTLHQIETPNIVEELRALDSGLAELRESQMATVDA
ncbi:hypothetical protein [Neptunomonas qingdaonensis]|uniref:SMODS and SLOG-associating 2TM effector domain-containing protein n=1 Tax=Neptunomonas qingdaonensis TaxID=1045558 RepID=A0A1I2QK29_9GAMM|nr:hypothetical protein [Neptunomonas qingdaonensis]SFG28772.1 hypothetical protein SAMN05216175_10512 [Neptunomonas qingdaonensis]